MDAGASTPNETVRYPVRSSSSSSKIRRSSEQISAREVNETIVEVRNALATASQDGQLIEAIQNVKERKKEREVTTDVPPPPAPTHPRTQADMEERCAQLKAKLLNSSMCKKRGPQPDEICGLPCGMCRCEGKEGICIEEPNHNEDTVPHHCGHRHNSCDATQLESNDNERSRERMERSKQTHPDSGARSSGTNVTPEQQQVMDEAAFALLAASDNLNRATEHHKKMTALADAKAGTAEAATAKGYADVSYELLKLSLIHI